LNFRINNNTRAFTIIDMMVSLLITSLLISFCYLLFKKSVISLTQEQEFQKDLQDIIWFEKKLASVVKNSIFIFETDISIIFQHDDLSYSLVISDTLVSLYENDYQKSPEFTFDALNIKRFNEILPVVSEIELVIQCRHILYPILLQKKYSKKTIFRLEKYEHKFTEP
jgi:Tfp pilus assembly protein PilE